MHASCCHSKQGRRHQIRTRIPQTDATLAFDQDPAPTGMSAASLWRLGLGTQGRWVRIYGSLQLIQVLAPPPGTPAEHHRAFAQLAALELREAMKKPAFTRRSSVW